jgi:glyoxylase-like metal-dependent hydrolase (beta-lactamase superfamily II)
MVKHFQKISIMNKSLFIGVLGFMACTIRLTAQSHPVVARDSTAFVEKIAKDVYVIIHENATDAWPHGNTGVVVGDNAVLVIDACYLPSRARADIKLIKSITKKPVSYLGITHWHMDHNNGIIAYVDSFPGIQILCEKKNADYIEINSSWWAKLSSKENSVRVKAIKDLERELTIGKDTVSGVPFSNEEQKTRIKVIEQRKKEIDELSKLQVIRPNKLFEKELHLQLGGKEVFIKDWGKANSPHDVTFYLQAEKIFFAGDMISQTPLPYTFESWPVTWAETLKKVEKIPINVIVPGHGQVMNDLAYTKMLRSLIEVAIAKVKLALTQGLTVDQLKANMNFNEFRKGVWQKSTQAPDSDWDEIIHALIDRSWKCVRGQGGE